MSHIYGLYVDETSIRLERAPYTLEVKTMARVGTWGGGNVAAGTGRTAVSWSPVGTVRVEWGVWLLPLPGRLPDHLISVPHHLPAPGAHHKLRCVTSRGGDMGPNWKLRRPFIWQDEMMEVRELFRRVDRVRNSGFTGFSTWESPPPSADTLSRNRLRRRRALCSVELSHLNYKEAPFESLNHLQNIRGMCTRIQRQDYLMERRKKDVDLIGRPPLLRRPVTSTSVERRGRKRPPFEVGRPYSAPPLVPIQSISSNSTRDIGPIPLQYATPKLTTLYDITQKSRSTSRNSTRKSFNILPPVFDQCPSTTPSKLRIANNYSIPSCTLMSEQNLPRILKPTEDVEPNGQIGLNLNSDMSNCKDHQSFARPIKSLKSSMNATIKPSINDVHYHVPQTTNSESCKKSNNSTYCAWSINDDTPTSSNIYSSSTLNYKPQTNELRSSLQDTNITSSFKGTEKTKPSFVRPISDYCSEPINCFRSKNNSSRHSSPSKTPSLFTKSRFDNLKASTYYEPFHERPSTPHLDENDIDDDEGKPTKMKGGFNTPFSLHEMNLTKNQTCLNDVERFIEKKTSNYNIAFDSTSNSTHSTLGENLGFVGQSSTVTIESRWLTTPPQKSSCKSPLHLELERIGNSSFGTEDDEVEQIIDQETTIIGVDDPNVLIKHSSNPYSDFRLSMVTMIEEEGLQDRQSELEELFQYYLDLNPKVHHDVLHKVIQDIRTDYSLKTF